jgi:hypothetical protein
VNLYQVVDIKDIKGDIGGMKQEIGEMKQEMDNQSGKSSLRWTRSTAVQIRVSPKGKSGNSIAAGVLCKINDRVFVATAAHVIMDPKKKCRREIELEQLGNGIITGTNVMIHSEADLALIEVANPRDQEYPVVSNKTGDLHEQFYGLSFREHGQVAVSGRIMEKISDVTFDSDASGTHGFSGTGINSIFTSDNTFCFYEVQ